MTVQDVFEAVGAHAAGNMSDEDLHELECVACPSAGSCGGQFTANTMACVSERLGWHCRGLPVHQHPMKAVMNMHIIQAVW